MNKTILQFDIWSDENDNLRIKIDQRSFRLLLLTVGFIFGIIAGGVTLGIHSLFMMIL